MNTLFQQLRKFRLRFQSPELERTFRAEYARRSVRTVRSVMMATFVIYLLFCLRDIFILHIKSAAWYAEYAVMLPVFFSIILHSSAKNFPRTYPIDEMIAVLLIEANQLYFLFRHPSYASFALIPTIIIVFAVYTMFRLRFEHAFGLTLLISVVFQVAVSQLEQEARETLIRQISFLWVANILGAIGCYTRERASRKEFEATEILRAANDELTDANMAKTEFVSIASHELRSPLTAVMGLSALIAQTEQLSNRDRGMLKEIDRASKRMNSIIGALLEVAKIETGIVELKRTPLDVGLLVRSSAERLGSAAALKSQRIDIDVAEGLTLHADEEKLRVILENLIGNGLKYSMAGALVRVSAIRREGQMRIAVSDDGPGLTDYDKQHLFKKWQRLTAKPTGDESSTGLGLSIVKSFAELHGGTVRAESEGVGKGSTFLVELPLQS